MPVTSGATYEQESILTHPFFSKNSSVGWVTTSISETLLSTILIEMSSSRRRRHAPGTGCERTLACVRDSADDGRRNAFSGEMLFAEAAKSVMKEEELMIAIVVMLGLCWFAARSHLFPLFKVSCSSLIQVTHEKR